MDVILLAGGSSPWPQCWILHGFQRVSLGSGRDGVGSCVLPSFPCCPAPGDGRDDRRGRAVGGVARRRDCFPIVFHPTKPENWSFLLLTPWPCPPCCFAASSRTLQHGALCASQHLPGGKPPHHGQEGDKKQRKTPTLSPSFPSFPETKDCKYCRLPLVSCRSPVPQPGRQSWHGMWCGREGRRKTPWLPSWNMLVLSGCIPQGGISEGKG